MRSCCVIVALCTLLVTRTRRSWLSSAGDSGGAEIPLVELYRKDVLELVPIIRRDKVIFGVYEKDAKNMDVHGIFQAYERQAKRNGAQIVPGAELLSARWTGKFRIVNAARGIFQADTIIKCSGRVG